MLSADETSTQSFNSVSGDSRSQDRQQSRQQACRGEISLARRELCRLLLDAKYPKDRAAVMGDLACLAAANGRYRAAAATWQRALRICPDDGTARRNLDVFRSQFHGPGFSGRREFQRDRRTMDSAVELHGIDASQGDSEPGSIQPIRIAILSLLFNWPSTGGGTVHTMELAAALQGRGCDVLHVYAVCDHWGVGRVTERLPYPAVPLEFRENEWTVESVQDRFREAVDALSPDVVIITDSWNMKPVLAEAVADYPYLLRLAALECLCPLNNVRLVLRNQQLLQCFRNQLSEPEVCRDCVRQNGQFSGPLHQAERALAGFDSEEYPDRVRRAFLGAEAVLVVNPEIAGMVQPFARRVDVVPSGFDAARFPRPDSVPPGERNASTLTRLIFAGLVDEPMKGFSVLWEACQQIWQRRQDFELIVTGDAPSHGNARFVRWVGWQTQAALPELIRGSDILIFPTIAQEALGRTAVEAMGCGKPVIASSLGGLSWVVEDGVTGLLVRPGDPQDLAEKIERLLDDPHERHQMGLAGRQKFEHDFLWDVILDRHYVPLLTDLVRAEPAEASSSDAVIGAQ